MPDKPIISLKPTRLTIDESIFSDLIFPALGGKIKKYLADGKACFEDGLIRLELTSVKVPLVNLHKTFKLTAKIENFSFKRGSHVFTLHIIEDCHLLPTKPAKILELQQQYPFLHIYGDRVKIDLDKLTAAQELLDKGFLGLTPLQGVELRYIDCQSHLLIFEASAAI